MTRLLLIGKNGQLGWELERCLATLGEVRAVDFPEIDLSLPQTVLSLARDWKPEIIINAAAYTAVDQAETEREKSRQINAAAPGWLSEEAKRLDAIFIHYSTDYVFNGMKGSLYTEQDQPEPLNEYSAGKLEGERLVQQAGEDYLIFRTSWVYSLRQQAGFARKVLQWARQNPMLRIVDDQIGNPTWARMLAQVTAQVLARGSEFVRPRRGLYHLAGDGYASRLEWARRILELDPQRQEQVVKELLPASSEDFPTPARRPLFSALDCSFFKQTFGLSLPPWQEALRLAMLDISVQPKN